MGKKSSLKNLRKLAEGLPDITVYRPIGEVIKREEAVSAGMEVPSHLLHHDLLKKKSMEPQPLNHYRKMKDILAKRGSEGVLEYVESVKAYDEKRRQQRTAFETEEESAPTFDEGEE